MKRLMVCICALASSSVLAAEPPHHTFEKAAPDLYVDHGPVSNSIVYVTPEGVLVVDAQTHPADAEAVVANIRTVTKAPIKWLVIGQFHGDHYFGASVYKREGATIVAQTQVAAILPRNFDYELSRRAKAITDLGYDPKVVTLVKPDRTFDDKMTITLGGKTVELLHLGDGQNPGDTIVLFPAARTAYPSGTFVKDSWSNTGYTPSLDGWIAMLAKVKALDVDVYVPGHDDVVRDKAEIDEEAAFLRELKAGVTDAIVKGLSAEDTAKTLTFEKYKDWRNYETRERNVMAAYYLVKNGRAQYFDQLDKAAKP